MEQETRMEFDERDVYTAQKYLLNLSCGRSPLEGTGIPEDLIWNEPAIREALTLAADLLHAYLQNGGFHRMAQGRLRAFHLTESERAKIPISEEPIGVMALAENIAKVTPYDMKRLSYATIANWLTYVGALEWTVNRDGERKRLATTDGNLLGLQTVERTGVQGRVYQKNVFDENAQHFVIDNLDSIVAHSANPEGHTDKGEAPA